MIIALSPFAPVGGNFSTSFFEKNVSWVTTNNYYQIKEKKMIRNNDYFCLNQINIANLLHGLLVIFLSKSQRGKCLTIVVDELETFWREGTFTLSKLLEALLHRFTLSIPSLI